MSASWLDLNAAASEAYSNVSPFSTTFVNNADFNVGSGSASSRANGITDSGATGTSSPASTASAVKGGGTIDGAGSGGIIPSQTTSSSFLWLLAAAGLISLVVIIKK